MAESQKRSAVYDILTNPTSVTVEVRAISRTLTALSRDCRAGDDGRGHRGWVPRDVG